MNIIDILINHMKRPLGFKLDHLRVEFKIDHSREESIQKQLLLSADGEIIYQTDFLPYPDNVFTLDPTLNPRTTYTVEIRIKQEDGTIISDSTSFETGKMQERFNAHWIANKNKSIQNTLFRKNITLNKPVAKARLYMTALGVYETSINGKKVGNEFLAPGVTAYDQWVQLQTYDITDYLQEGDHELLITTADGWYKGEYGFIAGVDCIYGDQHKALAEYHIIYTDGSQEVISTDSSWETTIGQVSKSSIYYGEDLDATAVVENWEPVIVLEDDFSTVTDRLSLPLTIKEVLPVQEIITTPKGETVLDFGQNHAGLFEFYNREPKGTKLFFQVAEILQKDNFYRENLRSARAGFEYISDGVEKWVRPHFSYYGYRYLKVEGNTQPIQAEDFKADVIYSDIASTGQITTQHEKVNRLFENVIWGQKSNFFDVPTDCPQRDERLGWTGDANVFSNTAIFNMDVYAFFKKYLKDIAIEQDLNSGRSPMYAPAMGNLDGGSSIWGDATTFIPWNLYQTSGDASILIEHYPAMKAWVDWITQATSTPNLWTNCFQFGDWLALDGENPGMPTGKTNEDFIASVYYHYSAHIVAETAKMMNLHEEAKHYSKLSDAIYQAIREEYISKNGRLTIDTQTAYALALQFHLVPEDQIKRVMTDLVTRLNKDDQHLKTGFVGTPYINQMLSKYGEHKLATSIFLHEDYPSWIYAVNMGATTVWERWNSVETDGSMNPEGMNSLNHYSIGAIMEWAYKYVLGLRNPQQGYQTFEIAPEFDNRLHTVSGHYDSPYGKIRINYQIETDENHTIQLAISVPFGTTAQVRLPRSEQVEITINQETRIGGTFTLSAGDYQISYRPTQDYIERYTADTPVATILEDATLVAKIDSIDPVLNFFRNNPNAAKGGLEKLSIQKLNEILPFITISDDHLAEIATALTSTVVHSKRKE